MTDPETGIHRTWAAAVSLIAVLAAVAFVPPHTVFGVSLRRANILSDLVRFDDALAERAASAEEVAEATPEELDVDFEQIAELISADTAAVRETPASYEWILSEECAPRREMSLPEAAAERVPIEDFDTTGLSPLTRFIDRLAGGDAPVRIAVLGDSFIEGDIMTSDLRRMLQQAFGAPGDCSGFAPMASPLTAFRRTVKTRSSGWTSYNVMQQAKTPAALRDKYMLGGWVCAPSAGAQTRWETVPEGGEAAFADVYFLSPQDSRVEVTLNDTLSRRFDVAGSPQLRRVKVAAGSIASLSFRVLSGTESFVGYGASLYGGGVTVDNYSVRSNSGQALLRMNPSLNAQLDKFAPYDLVVLQYGLNIMQQGRHDYRSYTAQVEKMIELARHCFPSAAVLVLGVSDRSVRADGGFEPMDALASMTEAQRAAARNSGAAFWSTWEAMRREGGMARFVANGWAGKDYTHINFAGGSRIASALCEAVFAEVRKREGAAARRVRLLSAEGPAVTGEVLERVDSILASHVSARITLKTE